MTPHIGVILPLKIRVLNFHFDPAPTTPAGPTMTWWTGVPPLLQTLQGYLHAFLCVQNFIGPGQGTMSKGHRRSTKCDAFENFGARWSISSTE